ncbi:hypothetical protein [Sporosarcina sp. OR05]
MIGENSRKKIELMGFLGDPDEFQPNKVVLFKFSLSQICDN